MLEPPTTTRSIWTKYTTCTGLECAYRFDEGDNDYRFKVLSKLPIGYYYSAFNEAGEYFDEVILPTLNPTPNETPV